MAIVKFTNSQSAVKRVIDYISNEEKTEGIYFSGINCMPETAAIEMEQVKLMYDKTDERQYYHIVQGFNPADKVDPKTAHELGVRFAGYFSGYQVVVATHTNTENVHNHIVFNAVSFENGLKYHLSKADMDKVKEFSNELCVEYGFTPTPIRKDKTFVKQSEYRAAVKGESWKFRLMYTIDLSMKTSANRDEFIANMEQRGYKVKWENNRKNITYTDSDGNRSRDNKLHDTKYLKGNMENEFRIRKTESEMCAADESGLRTDFARNSDGERRIDVTLERNEGINIENLGKTGWEAERLVFSGGECSVGAGADRDFGANIEPTQSVLLDFGGGGFGDSAPVRGDLAVSKINVGDVLRLCQSVARAADDELGIAILAVAGLVGLTYLAAKVFVTIIIDTPERYVTDDFIEKLADDLRSDPKLADEIDHDELEFEDFDDDYDNYEQTMC